MVKCVLGCERRARDTLAPVVQDLVISSKPLSGHQSQNSNFNHRAQRSQI